MKDIISKHDFSGNINTDTEDSNVSKKDVRDAVNTDTTEFGKEGRRVNIKGTLKLSDYTDDNTDKPTLNVLATLDAFAKYDYDGTGEFVEYPTVVIWTWDKNNLSRITLFDVTNSRTTVLMNAVTNGDLMFPPTGTVSPAYDKEQDRNKAYWDDNVNKLRSIVLEWSADPSWNPPTIRDVETEKQSAGIPPTLERVEQGGLIEAGSHQIAYRFFNKTRCEGSGWSMFTNPIPVKRTEGADALLPINDANVDIADTYVGAAVGEKVDKRIVLSITPTAEAAFYDSIQLAIVKHVDGSTNVPTIAYITDASESWYDNMSEIIYDGVTVGEVEVPIEDVVIDDAAIERARVLQIKNNRMFRGDIKYFEREFDNGDLTFDNAMTIQKVLDQLPGSPYKRQEQTHDNRGYFHEECYAYGGVYFDNFGNFGRVQAFDFSQFYREMRNGDEVQVVNIVAGTDPIRTDAYNVTMNSGTASINIGDLFEINGNVVQVAADLGSSVYLVYGDPGATTPVTGYKLHGQAGNQSTAWSWKFPARSDNQFTLLNEDGFPTALGLRIMGIKNHPSWAAGFAVVRQPRKKNILYQTPVIPCVGAQGVPTQGVGPITADGDGEPNTSRADYKGEFDCIVPKVFAYGCAKNFYKREYKFGDTRQSQTYFIYLPELVNQGDYEISTGNLKDGAEAPRYVAVIPPDYVFNHLGEPYYAHVFNGSESLKIVDGVAHVRKRLVGVDEVDGDLVRVNAYQSLTPGTYFYSRSGRTISGGQPTYFRKIDEIENEYVKPIEKINIEESYNIVLSAPRQLLNNKPFSSDEFLKDIDYFGAAEELSVQQGESNAVPAGTDSFLNQIPNQRVMLLNIDERLYDFTLAVYGGTRRNDNYFPDAPSVFTLWLWENPINSTLLPVMGEALNPTAGDKDDQYLHVKPHVGSYPAAAPGFMIGASYIANVVAGLTDNRYQKNSDEWYFTGAFVAISQADIQNNTPIDIDVWGGDCFVTKQAVKINNNTLRISAIFDPVPEESDDYYLDLGIRDKSWIIKKVRKLGSFETNVEILEMYLESEVNTSYYQKDNEYPAFKDEGEDNVGSYNKPYLYRYNFGYSAQNRLRRLVAQVNDCVKNNGRYFASFIWSDQRIYQAETNEFFYADGFARYPIANRRDLEEKYGTVMGLIDFGDDGLHIVQERKIRFEPINRSIIQDAGGNLTTVLGEQVVSDGGYYLPFDNGSQHMRTIKQRSGVCFLIDERNRQVIMFSSKGGNRQIISELGTVKHFGELLSLRSAEHMLSGHIDARPDNMEYMIVQRADGSCNAIIYSTRTKGWKTRIDTGADHILDAISCDQGFFMLDNAAVYSAWTNPMRGFIFEKYRDSEIVFIPNEMNELVKVWNGTRWDMVGGFVVDKDKMFVEIEGDGTVPAQLSFDCFAQRGSRPRPVWMKNFQWYANQLRNAVNKAKLFGRVARIRIIIRNDQQDNREVGIDQVEVVATTQYHNR